MEIVTSGMNNICFFAYTYCSNILIFDMEMSFWVWLPYFEFLIHTAHVCCYSVWNFAHEYGAYFKSYCAYCLRARVCLVNCNVCIVQTWYTYTSRVHLWVGALLKARNLITVAIMEGELMISCWKLYHNWRILDYCINEFWKQVSIK